ncbi:hypothetical protein BGW38_007437 [Lunasporangiospora selenospora]|uniref:Uncharacterized protein n=1 Tax=Lunasporangiospora selenospora TaxID=979761 RepID=A0A9P6FZ78_9FUNG|nr:hypothetical protein BGW38_007437 [Lunasporangiospora selenospora]
MPLFDIRRIHEDAIAGTSRTPNNSQRLALSTPAATNMEGAEKLLATILSFYRETRINPTSPSYASLMIERIETFARPITSVKSPAVEIIAQGDIELERLAAHCALTAPKVAKVGSAISMPHLLIYALVNILRPLQAFREAIEVSQSKEKLNRDLLRSIASSTIIDMIGENSLPNYARTSIMHFVFDQADFMLHHLESRVQLMEKIGQLQRNSPYNDIEFKSAVSRLSAKLGLKKTGTPAEQIKTRSYWYLDQVVSDPVRYSNQKEILSFMDLTQWAQALDYDLILRMYRGHFPYQILMFLEAAQESGIQIHLGSQSPFEDILCDSSPDSCGSVPLVLHQVLQEVFGGSMAATRDSIDSIVDYLLDDDPRSNIRRLDAGIVKAAGKMMQAAKLHLDLDDREKALDSLKQMLGFVKTIELYSTIAPRHFLPRLTWANSILLRVTASLLDKAHTKKDDKAFKTLIEVLQEIKAVCLDVWLACLNHRREPRNRSCHVSQVTPKEEMVSEDIALNFSLYNDPELCLALFTVLFPAQELSTWTTTDPPETDQGNSLYPSAITSWAGIFLLKLFSGTLALLERANHEGDATTTILPMMLAMTEKLSFQIPAPIVVQHGQGLLRTLANIADMERSSSVATLLASKDLQPLETTQHSFAILESRICALHS